MGPWNLAAAGLNCQVNFGSAVTSVVQAKQAAQPRINDSRRSIHDSAYAVWTGSDLFPW